MANALQKGAGTAGGALAGAGTGATIGSAVPIVGNVLGAGIGALVGGLASLFGGAPDPQQQMQQVVGPQAPQPITPITPQAVGGQNQQPVFQFAQGGVAPQAQAPQNNPANDTLASLLTPGETVIPVSHSGNPIAAALFAASKAQEAKAIQDSFNGALGTQGIQQATQNMQGYANGGVVTPGNIDLKNRPRVQNADGTVSTVRSMSFNSDGHEVLVPTVSEDGRIMSDDEAVQQYFNTGRHLGIFETPEAATDYANKLHNDQADLIKAPAPTGYANGGVARPNIYNELGDAAQSGSPLLGLLANQSQIPNLQGQVANQQVANIPGNFAARNGIDPSQGTSLADAFKQQMSAPQQQDPAIARLTQKYSDGAAPAAKATDKAPAQAKNAAPQNAQTSANQASTPPDAAKSGDNFLGLGAGQWQGIGVATSILASLLKHTPNQNQVTSRPQGPQNPGFSSIQLPTRRKT